MSERIKRAKRMNRIMTAVFYAVAVFFLILLAAFAGKVIIGGFLGAKPEMFGFDRQGCIGNQLFNTVYLVLVALVCSVPVGIFAGIYLAVYAKQGILTRFLRICIETLSSLPSIVVGLFGYLVFLVFMGMGKSLLAGALSVSILTLPLLTTTTEDAVKGLPEGYFQGSLGLGATKWQSVFHVILPACIPRIMTGVILAVCMLLAGLGGVPGWAMLAAALAALWRYAVVSKRDFGGITGDLAGWFLQRCELWMLAALVAAELLAGKLP